MLEVQEIHTYYGSSYVLQGVSLMVGLGEIVCILGRNGAGKTTTLKSIMGILTPRRGSVKYNGREIKGLRPFKIARMGIEYVPEDKRIYPDFTVRENLEVVPRNLQREAQWGFNEVFTLFPQLKMIQKRLGGQLSGGEKQMLTIARALVGNPELLLLDEPCEGLAPMVVASLLEAVKKIRSQGVTVLLTEQNVHFCIKLSDRVYILDEGKVVFEGTSKDFLQHEDLAKKYLLV
jgi:branched-chain amino acid transport system ATP-binding protein